MAKTVKLNPKVTPTYKYKINDQIGQLPREISINDLVAHIGKHGISRDEFYRDRAIKFGSDKSIPSDRLMIYAKVFDCSTEELMNHEVNAKSIREVAQKAVKSTLKVIALFLLSINSLIN